MKFAKPQITFPNRNSQSVSQSGWQPTAISIPLTYHMNCDYAIPPRPGRYHFILASPRSYNLTVRPRARSVHLPDPGSAATTAAWISLNADNFNMHLLDLMEFPICHRYCITFAIGIWGITYMQTTRWCTGGDAH